MSVTPITTGTAAYAHRPDLVAFAAKDVIPDALPLVVGTVVANVQGDAVAARVPYVKDDAAAFIAEGAEIPLSDPELAEAVIYTGKVAQLVPMSREQFNKIGTSGLIANSVQRAIVTKANTAFLNQVAPTAPAVTPPRGILTTTGLVPGGAVAGDLDVLVDLVATLQENGATPSHILLAPDAWAEIRKLKTGSTLNSTLLGAGTDDAAPRLLGIPVIVDKAMTTLTGAVIDRAEVLVAAGQVEVADSEHALFTRDSVLLRATWRFGAVIPRPDRIGTFTVTAAA